MHAWCTGVCAFICTQLLAVSSRSIVYTYTRHMYTRTHGVRTMRARCLLTRTRVYTEVSYLYRVSSRGFFDKFEIDSRVGKNLIRLTFYNRSREIKFVEVTVNLSFSISSFTFSFDFSRARKACVNGTYNMHIYIYIKHIHMYFK